MAQLYGFSWLPELGDPTPLGWITVLLYFAAAADCILVMHRLGANNNASRTEGCIWLVLAVLFVALGINKQLDLQSTLTDLGRSLAVAQGWYEQRRLVQFALIILLTAGSLAILAMFGLWLLRTGTEVWLALIGSTFLLVFILARAASFHHFDEFIGTSIVGFHWHWVLEIAGILFVLLASRRRHRLLASASQPPVDMVSGNKIDR